MGQITKPTDSGYSSPQEESTNISDIMRYQGIFDGIMELNNQSISNDGERIFLYALDLIKKAFKGIVSDDLINDIKIDGSISGDLLNYEELFILSKEGQDNNEELNELRGFILKFLYKSLRLSNVDSDKRKKSVAIFFEIFDDLLSRLYIVSKFLYGNIPTEVIKRVEHETSSIIPKKDLFGHKLVPDRYSKVVNH